MSVSCKSAKISLTDCIRGLGNLDFQRRWQYSWEAFSLISNNTLAISLPGLKIMTWSHLKKKDDALFRQNLSASFKGVLRISHATSTRSEQFK